MAWKILNEPFPATRVQNSPRHGRQNYRQLALGPSGHLDRSALDIYPPEEKDDDSKYATW
jgi:hypothetical protein